MSRDYLIQKDVDYINELISKNLITDYYFGLTIKFKNKPFKIKKSLLNKIMKNYSLNVKKILTYSNKKSNSATSYSIQDLPNHEYDYFWLNSYFCLFKDSKIEINFDLSCIKDNTNELSIAVSYNLFTPEIYILDETEKNLIKIKNPYYKEFKAKLDQLINFLKQEFKKQNIEYTVIADSAESFKPKNMSSEEYRELLKSRVKLMLG